MDGENIAILVMQIFVAIMMLTIFATIIVQLQVIGRTRNYFTPIQKEIRDEERTIKQLKKQKVDMQRLEELKRKREALFEEVGDRHVDRVEVKHAPQHQVDSRVKAFALEGYTDLGIKMLDVNFADGTQTVFNENQHDLKLVELFFKSNQPFTERDVMK